MADFGKQFEDEPIRVSEEDAPTAFIAIGRLHGFQEGKRAGYEDGFEHGYSDGWEALKSRIGAVVPGFAVALLGCGMMAGDAFGQDAFAGLGTVLGGAAWMGIAARRLLKHRQRSGGG